MEANDVDDEEFGFSKKLFSRKRVGQFWKEINSPVLSHLLFTGLLLLSHLLFLLGQWTHVDGEFWPTVLVSKQAHGLVW
ncbi:unnamed protein product [Camellia sinensis]